MSSVPRHVAIIMDGNGRWAQERKHIRFFGHVRGTKRVSSIVREANHLKIKALTLYAFSTENWQRPEKERNVLWNLFKKFLKKEIDKLLSENVRLNAIGEIHRLPEDVQQELQIAIAKLEN